MSILIFFLNYVQFVKLFYICVLILLLLMGQVQWLSDCNCLSANLMDANNYGQSEDFYRGG